MYVCVYLSLKKCMRILIGWNISNSNIILTDLKSRKLMCLKLFTRNIGNFNIQMHQAFRLASTKSE